MRDDAPTARLQQSGLVSLPPPPERPQQRQAGYRRVMVYAPIVAVAAGLCWLSGPGLLPLPRAVAMQLHQIVGTVTVLAVAAAGLAWMLASAANERAAQHGQLAEEIRGTVAAERIRGTGAVAAQLAKLAPLEDRVEPSEHAGGSVVAMPNSRVFDLGREFERKRLQRDHDI